jgi:prephenate dehydratase
MSRVIFQGIAGAYSEEAIHQFFGPEAIPVPCATFSDMFVAVEAGEADYAMLPMENAVAGSVNQSYELLMEHDLRIYGEVILHVRHMLLAPPGAQLSDLKRVRSHPQALSQCQRYLANHRLTPETTIDTAASARDLAANPETGTAVIASKLAADLYGLEILDRDTEDFPFNYTRFFVLSLEAPPRAQRNKTSLVFTTPHQPGALYACMGELSKRGINLTKIESRPRLNRPWQYHFYLDFEGHCQDPQCEAAIMGLRRRSSFVKLLGSYPAATTPVLEEDGATLDKSKGQEGTE